MQDCFQYRNHVPLADRLHTANGLPLCHCVDGIDVIDARFAVVPALLHCIDAPVSWLAEHSVLAMQNPAQRRTAQILVRGIGGRAAGVNEVYVRTVR